MHLLLFLSIGLVIGMAGIACNGSRKTMLENAVNKTAPSNLTIRLFKNNVVPADSDNVDASGFTEANFTGYAGQSLTAASWSVTSAHPAVATYPQVTFTSSADQTAQLVYGYYVTNGAGQLVVAEAFSDGPYSIAANGQTIKVTPAISLTD